MISKFISSNPLLAILIIAAIIAIVSYLVRKARAGSTNSPNNTPSDPTNGTRSTDLVYRKTPELLLGHAPDAIVQSINSSVDNSAKIADMAGKSYRNTPAVSH